MKPVLACALSLFLAINSFPAVALTLTPEQKGYVEKANIYMNELHSFRARFIQIAPDGAVSEGEVLLRKPGRARFDFDDPVPLLLIADGTWFIVLDQELETADRYPIAASPVAALLDDGLDLTTDADILEVQSDGGMVRIRLTEKGEQANGDLTLVFSHRPFELKQWMIRDAQGLVTGVALDAMEKNVDLPIQLFTYYDEAPGSDRDN